MTTEEIKEFVSKLTPFQMVDVMFTGYVVHGSRLTDKQLWALKQSNSRTWAINKESRNDNK